MRSQLKSFILPAVFLAILAIGGCNKAASNAAASPTPHPPFLPYASPTATNPDDLMPRVRPEDAIKQLSNNEAVLIDVRGTSTYQQEHIKGSLDFPLDRLNQGDFKGLPRDKKIIAYCT